MKNEPARIFSLITAAITSTIGVLVLTDVVTETVGGALSLAAGAWVLVAGELVRSRVTPVAALPPVLGPPAP